MSTNIYETMNGLEDSDIFLEVSDTEIHLKKR